MAKVFVNVIKTAQQVCKVRLHENKIGQIILERLSQLDVFSVLIPSYGNPLENQKNNKDGIASQGAAKIELPHGEA